MPEPSKLHVLQLLTSGSGLEVWKTTGVLTRELAVLRRLEGTLGKLSLISFAPGDHEEGRALGWDVTSPPASRNARGLRALFSRGPLWRIWLVGYAAWLRVTLRLPKGERVVIRTNQLLGAGFAWWLSRLLNRPYFIRMGYYYGHFQPRSLRRRLWERWVFRGAAGVICTSQEALAFAEKEYGLDPARTLHSPNVVDTELFKPEPQARKHVKRVLSVGRVHPRKNLSLVVRALAQVPGFELQIAGDGEDLPHVLSLARELGVHVEALGKVANERVPELMRQADVFVLSSTFEGNPKTLVEAMACGLICLASDVPGTREVFKNGEEGLLLPLQTEAWVEAFRSLLRSPEAAQKLGQNARTHAVEVHDLGAAARREAEFIERVLFGTSSSRLRPSLLEKRS